MADDAGEIMHLVNLYGVAIDSLSWDLFDQIFTSNVDADYGASRWNDLQRWKADFAASHAALDATHHAMQSHLVEVDGDVAHAMTYGSWRLIRYGVEGGDCWEGVGWYDDDLVRQDGRWLIKRRACRISWWGGNPGVTGAPPRLNSLRAEASAGRVGYLGAVRAAAKS